ncbi:MAG: hypothetical protein R3F55_21090 [Alphaproteobacteria bacterium]
MSDAVLHPRRPMGRLLLAGCGVAVVAAAIVVAVQGVAGFGGWLGFRAERDGVAVMLAEVDRQIPFLADTRTDAPALYEQVVAVVARDVDLGLGPEQVVADVTRVFETWQAEAMPDAPDRILMAYHQLAIDRMRELQRSNPSLCAALTLGKPYDDLDAHVSERQRQREMYVNRELLRARAGETVSRMTNAEVQSIARGIAADLSAAIGAAAELLHTDRQTTAEEDAIVCGYGIATMEAISALGPDRAPAVVRGLFFPG